MPELLTGIDVLAVTCGHRDEAPAAVISPARHRCFPRWAIAGLLSLAILCLSTPGPAAAADVPVHIGILAFRPAADVQQRWHPLVDYLNEQIDDHRFEIRAMGYADLEAAIARRQVDFVLTNPGHYLLMTYRNGLSSPLATLVPMEDGRRLSKFGGVVFTRADRTDIRSIADLRGHHVAAVTTGSLGGYQAQAMELLSAGIEIPRDVTLTETGMPHDRVVNEIIDGRAEVGFVRTGILERMASEGKLDLASIRVIAPRNEGNFPLLLSTRLYPEWPFAAMPGVDQDLARRVAGALLSIPQGGALANALDIHGFTIPTDYEVVHSMLNALRLPPFDAAPHFTMSDIWEKYRLPIVVGGILLVIVMLLIAWLILLNQRLAEGRARIERNSLRWHGLLDALGEGVYGVDRAGRCIFVNPAALAMLGYSEREMLGSDQHQLFHHHREDGRHFPEHECPVFLTLKDGEPRNGNDWFWRKDGSGFPVSLTTTPMSGESGEIGSVVVFRDISAQCQLETQLRLDATTDPLTGVANRRSFLESLDKELIRFKRFGYPAVATLLMADIDHFKDVNDRFGHAVGDEALRHFTQLARRHLRTTDVIGRLGGEEFGILLPITDDHEGLEFARRFCAVVEANPARTEQGKVFFTVSLGLTELGFNDETPEDVLERADAALYRAKAAGRNRVELASAKLRMPDGGASGRFITHLRWREGYACGEPTIDREHEELFRLANALLAQAVQSYDDEALTGDLKPAIDNLIDHVVEHFAHEEAILQANGYAALDTHARIHRSLVDHARTLRAKLDTDIAAEREQLSRAVGFLVVDMIAMHMLKEDRRFFRLFESRPR
jgi:diguanylate cyclase (GGDEF)-like protein/hemerythrin-like metal-binding protein/PAS domain S-box-containing protein